MGFEIDTNLHWTDHYVEHGFCVIKGAIDKEFCRRGIAEFQKELGTNLPPQQWSTATLQREHHNGRVTSGAGLLPFIEAVYDEPGLRAAIDTMFAPRDEWDGERGCQPFLCVFDPANKPLIPRYGHVDFLEVRIPILGNGFAFQASLIDTEPFSGNITIYPGYHKAIQKRLLEDANFWFSGNGARYETWLQVVPEVEPYEFVAEAGDVLFFHHLVGHEGNANAAANHTPRVAIHGQVSCRKWLQEIDPARSDLSPFERSLALNGPIKLPFEEEAAQHAAYAERKFRWQMERWVAERNGTEAALPYRPREFQ